MKKSRKRRVRFGGWKLEIVDDLRLLHGLSVTQKPRSDLNRKGS